MSSNSRLIGPFWVVWDKIVGDFISLDDGSKYIVHEDNCIRYKVDRIEAWERLKQSNDLPKKKGPDDYPHGEVVFDEIKCKFSVSGTPKLMHNTSFQKKLIKTCGLNQWTIFIKE